MRRRWPRQGLIWETVDRFGRLDVVFSNAGIGGRDDNPSSMDLEEWNRVLDVNLTGMFLVDRIAANKMKELGNGGSIINTASMSGHIINKGSRKDMSQHMVAYSAAKAGVIQLTKSIAMDMSALETYVENEVPMGRFASLDEIMGIVVFLASDLSSYATGSDFIIDGGVTIW